jgi:hypothetical protein
MITLTLMVWVRLGDRDDTSDRRDRGEPTASGADTARTTTREAP